MASLRSRQLSPARRGQRRCGHALPSVGRQLVARCLVVQQFSPRKNRIDMPCSTACASPSSAAATAARASLMAFAAVEGVEVSVTRTGRGVDIVDILIRGDVQCQLVISADECAVRGTLSLRVRGNHAGAFRGRDAYAAHVLPPSAACFWVTWSLYPSMSATRGAGTIGDNRTRMLDLREGLDARWVTRSCAAAFRCSARWDSCATTGRTISRPPGTSRSTDAGTAS
jgi:hypothetical protein